jgi:hypothetical protein
LKLESKIITEVASIVGSGGCSVVTTVARKVHHPTPFVDSLPHKVNIYVHARCCVLSPYSSCVECNNSPINHTRKGISITFTQ